jgi:hypothetical protein
LAGTKFLWQFVPQAWYSTSNFQNVWIRPLWYAFLRHLESYYCILRWKNWIMGSFYKKKKFFWGGKKLSRWVNGSVGFPEPHLFFDLAKGNAFFCLLILILFTNLTFASSILFTNLAFASSILFFPGGIRTQVSILRSLMSASTTDEDPVCSWSVGSVVWCIFGRSL